MNATRCFARSLFVLAAVGCATPPTLVLEGVAPVSSTAGRATVVSLSPWIKDESPITRLMLKFDPTDARAFGYELVVLRPDGACERVRFARPQMRITSDARFPLLFEFEVTPDDAAPAASSPTTWTRSLELRPMAGFETPSADLESLTYELRATVEPVSIALEPALVRESSGGFSSWTYPIFGLPRDLVDAPLTALNRVGFGAFLKSNGYDGPRRSEGATWWAISAATWGGFAYGAVRGVRAAGPHLAKEIAYGFGYGLWSGFVYGGAAAGAALGYALAVVPTQTALLRTPYDDMYWKGKRTDIVLDGGWPDENVAAWEHHERSFAFFPNWRFGVRGEHRALPGAEGPTVTVWVVRSIDVREIAAPTP